jgi:hypothetical protein
VMFRAVVDQEVVVPARAAGLALAVVVAGPSVGLAVVVARVEVAAGLEEFVAAEVLEAVVAVLARQRGSPPILSRSESRS